MDAEGERDQPDGSETIQNQSFDWDTVERRTNGPTTQEVVLDPD